MTPFLWGGVARWHLPILSCAFPFCLLWVSKESLIFLVSSFCTRTFPRSSPLHLSNSGFVSMDWVFLLPWIDFCRFIEQLWFSLDARRCEFMRWMLDFFGLKKYIFAFFFFLLLTQTQLHYIAIDSFEAWFSALLVRTWMFICPVLIWPIAKATPFSGFFSMPMCLEASPLQLSGPRLFSDPCGSWRLFSLLFWAAFSLDSFISSRLRSDQYSANDLRRWGGARPLSGVPCLCVQLCPLWFSAPWLLAPSSSLNLTPMAASWFGTSPQTVDPFQTVNWEHLQGCLDLCPFSQGLFLCPACWPRFVNHYFCMLCPVFQFF